MGDSINMLDPYPEMPLNIKLTTLPHFATNFRFVHITMATPPEHHWTYPQHSAIIFLMSSSGDKPEQRDRDHMNSSKHNYPTNAEREAAEAPAGPVNKWAIHRRMYDWVLGFAHSKHSTTALFVISFAESSFFPIPPDVLLGPLCLGKRSKALYFATVCTIASVLGAFLGYYIGVAAIDAAVAWIPGIEMGAIDDTSWKSVNGLSNRFNEYGQWFVFVAALTPIPFKLLTITAGAAKMNLLIFFVACLVGRSLRFYGVAGLFWWIGPKAVPFIDKYFNWLCIAFVVLLIGGFAVLKLF